MAKGARVEYMQFFDKRQPPSQALVARDVVALDQRTWSQKRQRQELPSHVDGVDASSSAGQSLDQRLASFVVSQLRKHEERTTTQLATTLYTFCVEARAHVSAAGGMRRLCVGGSSRASWAENQGRVSSYWYRLSAARALEHRQQHKRGGAAGREGPSAAGPSDPSTERLGTVQRGGTVCGPPRDAGAQGSQAGQQLGRDRGEGQQEAGSGAASAIF